MASYSESAFLERSVDFLLEHRVAIALPVILLIITAVFSRGSRQPPSTHRLPRLPGRLEV